MLTKPGLNWVRLDKKKPCPDFGQIDKKLSCHLREWRKGGGKVKNFNDTR